MRPAITPVAAILLTACASGFPQESASALVASHGIVVSGEPHASDVGVEIMKAGGSAIDAAVATGFALAVTLPSAGNLGGGGFMVIHFADGKDVAVDFREMAPAAATKDMFLGSDKKPVPELSRLGHRAVAVPGSVAGLCHVQKTWGRMPLEKVLAPAIRLARDGFRIGLHTATTLAEEARLLGRFPETRRIFLDGGTGRAEGTMFRQPELADVLERIAKGGRDGFYQGRTAELFAAEMERGGGLVTRADLAGYEVKLREPVRGTYRGFEVVSMPPPSSGGVALIQMLNILEGWKLAELEPRSDRHTHLVVESMRAAFRDRALYLGDPDFATVPARGLISKKYAGICRAAIGERATPSAELKQTNPVAHEKEQTTHFSVMDASGTAVACTTTLNGSFGCGVTVAGAGFLLNNEMDDFAAAPGAPNMYGLLGGEANAVAPRKRPLSSMTPTLLRKDGRVVLVIGSPGGPTIITTVLGGILGVVDYGLEVGAAVRAPRFHHQWVPDRIDCEAGCFSPEVAAKLGARGHQLRVRSAIGDAHGISFDPVTKQLRGGADPRRGGKAAGW